MVRRLGNVLKAAVKLAREYLSVREPDVLIDLLFITAFTQPLYPIGLPLAVVTLLSGLVSSLWTIFGLATLYLILLHVAPPLIAISVLVAGCLILKIIIRRRIGLKDLALLLMGLLSIALVREEVTTFTALVSSIHYWIIGKHTSTLAPLYLTVLVNFISIWVSNLAWSIKGVGKYFVENPGSQPVILFMITLVTAATFLALGDERGANKLAEIAYYSLVIGVALQIATVVKEERSGQELKKLKS